MLASNVVLRSLSDATQGSAYLLTHLAYVNRTSVPTHHSAEPVEFELLFRFWDGFGPRVPALLRSEYAAEA